MRNCQEFGSDKILGKRGWDQKTNVSHWKFPRKFKQGEVFWLALYKQGIKASTWSSSKKIEQNIIMNINVYGVHEGSWRWCGKQMNSVNFRANNLLGCCRGDILENSYCGSQDMNLIVEIANTRSGISKQQHSAWSRVNSKKGGRYRHQLHEGHPKFWRWVVNSNNWDLPELESSPWEKKLATVSSGWAHRELTLSSPWAQGDQNGHSQPWPGPWLSCDLAVIILKMPWLSCDLAMTELWPSRDWAVTSPWLSCDLS